MSVFFQDGKRVVAISNYIKDKCDEIEIYNASDFD